ncbi:hypothetical protein ACFSJW_18405 [Flavobacterium artemisiae]|uniref:Uncharacterized protein n=1 Tax=Flavobacterium artemisiae TaxID=2126556 RepID=A0ABW4HA32_9FLAO
MNYSQEYFERMQMMCRYFESQSKKNILHVPEFIASSLINDIIQKEEENLIASKKIEEILAEMKVTEHQNNVHWYDYKIHVMNVLKENKIEE